MKSTPIQIEGFGTQLSPDDRPALSIFGEEGTGKTRLACTMPAPIGYLAIDKKAKRTVESVAASMNLQGQILINQQPFMSDAELLKAAMIPEDKYEESKKLYTTVTDRIFDAGIRLASSNSIKSIVVDTNSQFYDFILFAHHGRKTQIDPRTGRSAPNQYLIDFINALRCKNLILIHRSKEVWKDTGEVDKKGKKLQAPSGKFKADGFSQLGGFVTATIELTNSKKPHAKVEEKFKARVITCQTNSMLEGLELNEYGISGESITWDGLMMAMGINE